MRFRPGRVYAWGTAGVPLFGLAVTLDGLLTLALWAIGGVVALIALLVFR